MAWVGDHLFSYAQGYVCGLVVNCPESAATVMTDLREIGPTYYFAPPRVLENLITQVMIRMEDAGLIKRKLFQYFMALARKVGPALIDGRPVGALDRLLYAAGRPAGLRPAQEHAGHEPRAGRLHGGRGGRAGDLQLLPRARRQHEAALRPDRSERVRHHPSQRRGLFRHGRQAGLQGRAAASPSTGEVLYRSPGVFKEYFKNPQATNDTKTADGWVHTGDAGYLDDRGHLRIIDRARDVGKLNDGTLFAPKFIENKLKFFPYINEAVAFGHGRDFVAVFVNIDMIAVGDWAERHNIAYASYQELAAHPDVYDLIQSEIERVNRDLAARSAHGRRADPPLPDPAQGARGRRRRAHPHQQGAARLHRRALQDAGRCALQRRKDVHIKVDMTFEDGRKGTIEGDIAIRDLPRSMPCRSRRRAEARWRGADASVQRGAALGREHQPRRSAA